MLRKIVLFSVIISSLLILPLGCAQPPASAPTVAPTKSAEPGKATAAPVASPASASPAPAKAAGAPATVRLGIIGNLTDAPILIADAKGYFKSAGLDVEISNFNTAAQMVAPLGTGQLDIGGGTVSAGLFNAVARGVDIKIVADKSSMLPGRAALNFVVRKDLADQIKDYKDLKGRTIATTPLGTSVEVELHEILKKGNLKFDDVKQVTMNFPDMLTAFSNKSIDVAVSIEPFTTQGVEKGLIVRWKGMDEIYPNHMVSVLLYSPVFAKAHPDAAKSFMVAYIKGARDYIDAFTKNKNKDEIVSILTKRTNVKDPALYDKMTVFGVSPDGTVNLKSLAYDQDYYLQTGQIQKKIDLSTLVDQQYVDYAVKELGKYQ